MAKGKNEDQRRLSTRGSQPTGRQWYLSGPRDLIDSDGQRTSDKKSGFRYVYSATPKTKRPGSVPASRTQAQKAAGSRAEMRSYASQGATRRKIAARKAANPTPRQTKSQVEHRARRVSTTAAGRREGFNTGGVVIRTPAGRTVKRTPSISKIKYGKR